MMTTAQAYLYTLFSEVANNVAQRMSPEKAEEMARAYIGGHNIHLILRRTDPGAVEVKIRTE